MNWDSWIPLLVLLSSLVPGFFIFLLREEQRPLRTTLNMAGAITKLVLVVVMVWGVFHGHSYETRLPMLPDLGLVLRADALGMLLSALSAALWLVTTLYAVGYLREAIHRSRFFGFFSLCVTATMGVALAGNLFTFLVFYEMLTLATYPLIVHRGTDAALRAGRVYLAYTLVGGGFLLAGVAWLHSLVGPVEFSAGGALHGVAGGNHTELIAIFALLIAGLGVKAALVPCHGWLPVAMVAPAPVSALLHAVAVVKVGAFGIVRVVFDVYGVELTTSLGVTGPLTALAAATIIYGSLRALRQDDLKRRLAYSTVSQVSYIHLGVAIAGPSAMIGGLVHLIHQGIQKITLFFCAGNVAETLGIHSVREMKGVGRRMPLTMVAFTVAAFGMIGVPPMAGFVSKWYLGVGSLEAGHRWLIAVLAASSVLNAAYFLPILYTAWFSQPPAEWNEKHPRRILETNWMLLVPPVLTAALVLLAGMLAGMQFSPLGWARLIAAREYIP